MQPALSERRQRETTRPHPQSSLVALENLNIRSLVFGAITILTVAIRGTRSENPMKSILCWSARVCEKLLYFTQLYRFSNNS
jgi:hypothetical protein